MSLLNPRNNPHVHPLPFQDTAASNGTVGTITTYYLPALEELTLFDDGVLSGFRALETPAAEGAEDQTPTSQTLGANSKVGFGFYYDFAKLQNSLVSFKASVFCDSSSLTEMTTSLYIGVYDSDDTFIRPSYSVQFPQGQLSGYVHELAFPSSPLASPKDRIAVWAEVANYAGTTQTFLATMTVGLITTAAAPPVCRDVDGP